MSTELDETTLKLISLTHFYAQANSYNEKIKRAVNRAESLTMRGVEESSIEDKLQFCSDAVEAITSVFTETTAQPIRVRHVLPPLDRDEVDFIKSIIFTNSEHPIDCKSAPKHDET